MKKIVYLIIAAASLLSCSPRPGRGTELLTDPSVEWEASWIGIDSPEDVRTGNVSMPARYLRTSFEAGKGKAIGSIGIIALLLVAITVIVFFENRGIAKRTCPQYGAEYSFSGS